MLSPGDRGPAVVQLQGLLRRAVCAGFGNESEGEYGPATETAVRLFQRLRGLEPTGVADDETLQRLERWTRSSATMPAVRPEELGIQIFLDVDTAEGHLVVREDARGVVVIVYTRRSDGAMHREEPGPEDRQRIYERLGEIVAVPRWPEEDR